MNKIYPDKLNVGDEEYNCSCNVISNIFRRTLKDIANKRFEELGLKLTFSKHIDEKNDFFYIIIN